MIQAKKEIHTKDNSIQKEIYVEDKHTEQQPWKPEEDKVLNLLRNGFSKSFEDIVKFFPRRTVQSLKIRFQMLNERKNATESVKQINEIEVIDLVDDEDEEMADISDTPSVIEASVSVWSLLDDMILKQSYKTFGNDWNELLKYFPDRTIDDIKNRWQILTGASEGTCHPEECEEVLQNNSIPDMALHLTYSNIRIGSFEWTNDLLAHNFLASSDNLVFDIGHIDSEPSAVAITLEKSDLRQMFTCLYEDLFYIICLIKPVCAMKIVEKLEIVEQDLYYKSFSEDVKEGMIIFSFQCNMEKDYYMNIENHFEQIFPGELIWSKMHPQVARKAIFDIKLGTNDQTNEYYSITESNKGNETQENVNNFGYEAVISDSCNDSLTHISGCSYNADMEYETNDQTTEYYSVTELTEGNETQENVNNFGHKAVISDGCNLTLTSDCSYNADIEHVTNDQTNENNLKTELNENSALQENFSNLDLEAVILDNEIVSSTRISDGICNNVENEDPKLLNVVKKTRLKCQKAVQFSKRKLGVKEGSILNSIQTSYSGRNKSWTASEDELLMKSYKKCKWNEICKLFPEKTPYALSMRVFLLKRQGSNISQTRSDNLKRDKENVQDENSKPSCSDEDSKMDSSTWTKEEDETLLNSVKKTKHNWKKVAGFLKGRQQIEIKERYISLLPPCKNPHTIRTLIGWTTEEDKLLMNSCNKYNNWNKIYSLFPDRTPLAVMARVNVLKQKGYNFDKEDQILLNSAKKTKHNREKRSKFSKGGKLTEIKERYIFLTNSKQNSHNLKSVWTTEEDELLLKCYKNHNWKEIYKLFPNRTHRALVSRFCVLKQTRNNYLKQRQEEIQRKSHKNLCTKAPHVYDASWTEKEDQKLHKLVGQFGRNWSKIALHFENKKVRQIKERYLFLTNSKQSPGLVYSRWTEEENELLRKSCKLSGNELLKLFPNRSLVSIKFHRFYLKKKECKHPDQVQKKVGRYTHLR